MYRVRYYDQQIHPDHFTRGVLGFVIRVLNWTRWRLETLVQRLTLKYLAREGGLPKERQRTIEEMFRLDVEAERLEKSRTSPRLPEFTSVEVPRADRYEEGGSIGRALEVASGKEEELPLRPRPASEMIARYMDPRRAKYARGRRFTVTHDEEDFEPVVMEK